MIKKYKALQVLAIAGTIIDAGKHFFIEELEAVNIGLGKYLEEVKEAEAKKAEEVAPEQAPVQETTPESTPAPTETTEVAPEQAPVQETTPENVVTTENGSEAGAGSASEGENINS